MLGLGLGREYTDQIDFVNGMAPIPSNVFITSTGIDAYFITSTNAYFLTST